MKKPVVIKMPKPDDLKSKMSKLKGKIEISLRKSWFSDAMTELDKQDKEKQ